MAAGGSLAGNDSIDCSSYPLPSMSCPSRSLLKTVSKASRKTVLHIAERNAVLRATRTGQAWFDRGEVEFQQLVEDRVRGVVGAEEPLGLGVALDEVDLVVGRGR